MCVRHWVGSATDRPGSWRRGRFRRAACAPTRATRVRHGTPVPGTLSVLPVAKKGHPATIPLQCLPGRPYFPSSEGGDAAFSAGEPSCRNRFLWFRNDCHIFTVSGAAPWIELLLRQRVERTLHSERGHKARRNIIQPRQMQRLVVSGGESLSYDWSVALSAQTLGGFLFQPERPVGGNTDSPLIPTPNGAFICGGRAGLLCRSYALLRLLVGPVRVQRELGFRVCVRITLSKSSPGGTAESSPGS